MVQVFDGSLVRLRTAVLDGEPGEEPALSPSDLDVLACPPAEHVEEIILLCLLAAHRHPDLAHAAGHVPWLIPTIAINHPDSLRPYLHAFASLVDSPVLVMRELAVNLVGQAWQKGDKSLLPYLLRGLRDGETQVVRAAVTHLRHCPSSQAAEVLEHCQRVLSDDELCPAEAEEWREPRPEVCHLLTRLVLVLGKRGVLNEAQLRRFFLLLQAPARRLALPRPFALWLAEPRETLTALLHRYTMAELGSLDYQF